MVDDFNNSDGGLINVATYVRDLIFAKRNIKWGDC